jgi:hypothetical protein
VTATTVPQISTAKPRHGGRHSDSHTDPQKGFRFVSPCGFPVQCLVRLGLPPRSRAGCHRSSKPNMSQQAESLGPVTCAWEASFQTGHHWRRWGFGRRRARPKVRSGSVHANSHCRQKTRLRDGSKQCTDGYAIDRQTKRRRKLGRQGPEVDAAAAQKQNVSPPFSRSASWGQA